MSADGDSGMMTAQPPMPFGQQGPQQGQGPQQQAGPQVGPGGQGSSSGDNMEMLQKVFFTMSYLLFKNLLLLCTNRDCFKMNW